MTKKDEMSQVERTIGYVLQIGVYISITIIIFGIILWFKNGSLGYLTADFPNRLQAILYGVIKLKAYAVIELGIFCLIFTPVLRVIVSIYAFYKENDVIYVYITTFVLIILMVGMGIGYLK